MEGVTIMPTSEWEAHKQNITELTKLVKQLAKRAVVNDPLLTSQEVQEYLKKGSTWVDANKHKIGCSRIGGEWRFRKSIVDQFINNSYHKDN